MRIKSDIDTINNNNNNNNNNNENSDILYDYNVIIGDTNETLDNATNKPETDTSSYEPTYKKTKTDNVDTNNFECKINQEEDTEEIVADYWNISNSEFKKQVYMIVDNDLNRQIKIKQWLETDDALLQFVRQRSCLIAHVYSLKIQQDFWKTYRHSTRNEAVWLSQMSKDMIKWNIINETFFETEKYMNKHLKSIQKQFKKAIEKLNEHLQERQQVLKLSTIDMSLLSAVMIAFTRQHQQQLRIEHEQKNTLLVLTANDIRFVKEFYDIKPTDVQISVGRTIWQTTIHEQQAQKEMNDAKRCVLEDGHFDFYSILQKFTIDPTMVSLTVNEFKERYITNQISLAQTKVEEYAHALENEKKRFLMISQGEQDPLSTIHSHLSADTILNIIESRQRTLIKRVQLMDKFPKASVHKNYSDDSDNNDDDGRESDEDTD